MQDPGSKIDLTVNNRLPVKEQGQNIGTECAARSIYMAASLISDLHLMNAQLT